MLRPNVYVNLNVFSADMEYVKAAESKEKSDVKKSPMMKLSATFVTTFE